MWHNEWENGTVRGSAVPFLPFLSWSKCICPWVGLKPETEFYFYLGKKRQKHIILGSFLIKSVFAPVGLLRRHITQESLYLHSFNCFTTSLLQRAELIPAGWDVWYTLVRLPAVTNSETTNLESLRSQTCVLDCVAVPRPNEKPSLTPLTTAPLCWRAS